MSGSDLLTFVLLAGDYVITNWWSDILWFFGIIGVVYYGARAARWVDWYIRDLIREAKE